MAATRKTSSRSAKAALTADLIEMAAAATAPTPEEAAPAKAASAKRSPRRGAPQARHEGTETASSRSRDQGSDLRRAMRETMIVSAQGALAVNGKVIDALTLQSHAVLDFWRSALVSPPSSSEAHRQANVAHQVYEAAALQWKDVAETAADWTVRSLEPLKSVLTQQPRP